MARAGAAIPRSVLTLSIMPDFTVSLSTFSDAVDYRNSRCRPPLLVSMAAILICGSRPTSDNVDSVISESGMATNMGLKLESRSICTVQKVISTSGLFVAILNSSNQPTSGNVGSVGYVSSIVANAEVAVGIVPPTRCVQYSYFSLRFRWPSF
jgi:hypothetical protein